MKLIALVLLFFGKIATCQYLKSEYKSSATYYDRYLLDSPYNLCRAPLMRQSVVSSLNVLSQIFLSKFQHKFT
jgi:hypothetical protein